MHSKAFFVVRKYHVKILGLTRIFVPAGFLTQD